MADFEVSGLITLDDSQLTSGINNARTGFSSIGSGIQSAGMQITKFGVGASVALAPVTLFLNSSIGAFRDFDVAMTNSQTILGATEEEMDILNAQILEMGANTGLGPQAVADSFFTVVSGVQDATTHMDILWSSVRLAEAGMADLAVTTDGMVAVMNSYQFAAEDAAFVSDVFTRTVQMGVGTMDEFVGALAPLASLADELQISFDDLAASEAFLTTQGQSAGAAATELQAIMTAFIKPSTGMTEALNAMGVESGLALIEAEGLQGAVDMLSASLGDDALALGEVFTRSEALKGALILAGDEAVTFGETFEEGIAGATDRAADLQNATDSAISDAFMAKVDVLKITLGEGLSGAIASVQAALTPLVGDLIQWAQDNPELVQQIMMVAGASVVFAGGLIVVGGLVTAVGAGISALTGLFGLLFSPVGLVIGAFVLLAGAFGLIDVSPITDELDKLILSLTGVENAATSALEAVKGVVPGGGTFSFLQGLATPVEEINPPGFASGGEADAFQPMMVGEEGPERITFPVPSSVSPAHESRGGGDGGMFAGATIHINANDYAGGRAAARGFDDQLTELRAEAG